MMLRLFVAATRRAVRLVGGKPQNVDEIGKGGQGEAVCKQEGDAQALLARSVG
ncbi:hypothetical protein [Chelativorans alearense]|uniref:hypothetical protein n=1 Tax=Chelativorans alearense TaxID=2681495 RepID=UPI001FE9E1F4|nr:hypothetical protein [Chelativorans alearense]